MHEYLRILFIIIKCILSHIIENLFCIFSSHFSKIQPILHSKGWWRRRWRRAVPRRPIGRRASGKSPRVRSSKSPGRAGKGPTAKGRPGEQPRQGHRGRGHPDGERICRSGDGWCRHSGGERWGAGGGQLEGWGWSEKWSDEEEEKKKRVIREKAKWSGEDGGRLEEGEVIGRRRRRREWSEERKVWKGVEKEVIKRRRKWSWKSRRRMIVIEE